MEIILLVWLLAGRVFAAIDLNDPCGKKLSSSDNIIIETRADADAFQSCLTIDPNLIIDKGFPGKFSSNLQKAGRGIFVGNASQSFVIESSTLTSLSFPALTYIDDDLIIAGAKGITELDFPVLEVIQGSLAVKDLPNLKRFTALRRLYHVSYTSVINTGLERLDWNTSTKVPVTVSFHVANNTRMDEINIPDLEDVSGGSVTIHGNGNTMLYNMLKYVSHLEVTGIKGWLELTSGFEELRYSANQHASTPFYNFYDNNFEILSFNQLEYTNGSISIYDNPNLSQLDFTFLERINGALQITNNPSLTTINSTSLQYLNSVSSINLTGAFEIVQVNMANIRPYSFILQSTGNVSCALYDIAWAKFWILDYYGCSNNGAALKLQTNSTRQEDSQEVSGSGGGGGGKIGKKGLLIIKIVVPIIGSLLWAGIIWFFCARHRRQKKMKEELSANESTTSSRKLEQNLSDKNKTFATTEQPSTSQRMVERGPEFPVANTQYEIPTGSASPPNTQGYTSSSAISRAENLDARERAVAERERQLLDAREADVAEKERRLAELETRHGGTIK